MSTNRNKPKRTKTKGEKSNKYKALKTVLKIIGTIILVGIITGLFVVGAFSYYVVNYLNPTMDIDLDSYKLNYTSYVYAVDPDTGAEIELEQLYWESNREWIDFDEIPTYAKQAAVAIEDERFYEHIGFDIRRTLAATLNLFSAGDSSFGGSTIHQQVVKNVTGDDEYSIMRKFEEILRAYNLNKDYSKDTVLEYYLNSVFFGQGTNGIQAAAKTYFNKDASELSLAECATIIGITKYPTYYNPFQNPENNKDRQETILMKMLELGFITQEEHDIAVAEELDFQKELAYEKQTEVQSWFVDAVIDDVISDLVEQKGYTQQYATDLVYMSGLKIMTTMDMDIQSAMDEVFLNEENFPETSGDVLPQASMSIVDPYTGAVLGLVGGRGEKTSARGWNHATTTERQPGSLIKPLAVYAPAIEYGVITMGSVYEDSPFLIDERYPKNEYTGYAGMMSISTALARSTNTVAVKVINDLTPQRAFDFMTENLGVTTLVKSETINGRVLTDIGISMALGGLTHGVTTLEMSSAFASFANKGVYNEPYTYSTVYANDGTILLENTPNPQVAMSESTAFVTNELLTNVVSTGTGYGSKIDGMQTAGKTGTTSDDKDRWFGGYTPYYSGVVWFGYEIPQTIVVSGGNPARILWTKVMEIVHEDLEPRDFADAPSSLVQAQYCLDSGHIATDACRNDIRGSRVATAWYQEGTQPSEPCTTHIMVNVDKETMKVASPYCPAESIIQVGMLNIYREYEYQINIDDAGYTYIPLPEGYELPMYLDVPIYNGLQTMGTNAGTGKTENNHICDLHWGEGYVPPEPDPLDPLFPDPTLPTDPTEPSDPFDPNSPDYRPPGTGYPEGYVPPTVTDPDEPVIPSEPDEQTDPTGPTEPTEPTEPEEPEEPDEPDDPTGNNGGFNDGRPPGT